jgi:tight adherence protein C
VDQALLAFFEVVSENATIFILIGVAIAASTLVAAIYVTDRSRRAVKLRLLQGTACDRVRAGKRTPQASAASQQIDTLVTRFGAKTIEQDPKLGRQLRAQLQQAGFFSRSALAYFLAIRILTGPLCGLLFYLAALAFDSPSVDPWMATAVGLGLGFVLPPMVLGRLVKRRRLEHRNGFPDVMDLLVVCAQAGLSMEAGFQKIGEEIVSSYPSLAQNLQLTCLELRNGKSLSQAVESLGERLGIDEATSFGTLLQQSEEIGASISESLRAYADDMRNKRLMRAEERAYALPAKLVVPLTLFVFPVLLVVLLLPAAVAITSSLV